MKTVGITAEYNPFHSGHEYHLKESLSVSGADRAVVIMSGSFVQRGEPSSADKFTRAEWAIKHGADMVIELPDVFALSCAERFAAGAVRILNGIGMIDSLCFGSESGNLSELKSAAFGASDGDALAAALDEGVSYPAAMQKASGMQLSPNDILGAEYIRAAAKYAPNAELYAVKRIGGGYNDASLENELNSAKAIRTALSRYSGQTKMSPAVFDALQRSVPRDVLEDMSELMKKGVFPASLDELSLPVLYRLRKMTAEETAALPEVAEGLENLYKKHSADSSDIWEMLEKIKSKRYTMARLKRIAMNALLGVSAELQKAACEDDSALYARVLAVKEGSTELLARIKECSSIPVIIQYSDRNSLPPLAAKIEAVSTLAHRIRALGQPYDKSAREDGGYRLIVR